MLGEVVDCGGERPDGERVLELAFLDYFRDVLCKVLGDGQDTAVTYRGVGSEEGYRGQLIPKRTRERRTD